MIINSSYYKEKFSFSKWDLNVIYNLYETWCNDNFQKAEVDLDTFINYPDSYFDHVVFHAEIIDNSKIEEILKCNTV